MAQKKNTYMSRTAGQRRRRQRSMAVREVIGVLLVVIACWGIYKWLHEWEGRAQQVEITQPPHLGMAAALQEVRLPEGTQEQIVEYPGFTVSFNAAMHMPNYVVWELTRDEVGGPAERLSNFFEDKSVRGCATLADYRKSGYSRGHMAPAADMKWSEEAMRASHNLTNVCPQLAAMNSGAWSTLEDNCRAWAVRDSALIIIAGPVATDRMPLHIGKNRVPVPERFFKVVLAPYVNPPRAIGFVMPNERVAGGVQACAMSVDEVEAITGMDFFSALPDDIENNVEKQNSYPRWQSLK